MKTIKGLRTPSETCSCTSCMYKSESERSSLRRVIADGSRIDRLYYGKYIPLRERKLLNRLVRTRAVYDDIRNQLLSESDVSVKVKPILKPKKHEHAHHKELINNKSSVILEIVDMVDKGKVVGPNEFSECCSCCSCGSNIIREYKQSGRVPKNFHDREGYMMPRSGAKPLQKIGKLKKSAIRRSHDFPYTMSRTSTMLEPKIEKAMKKIRFQVKSIRSAPCACTTQLSNVIKQQSEHIVRRLRPEIQFGEQMIFEGVLGKKPSPHASIKNILKERKRGRNKNVLNKVTRSKERIIESMGEGVKNLRESTKQIKSHIVSETKKSLEKINKTRRKMNDSMNATVERSVHGQLGPLAKERFNAFFINKDSLVKFKEKLRQKQQMHDYECEPLCIPGKCVPQECFKIIKLKNKLEKRDKQKQLYSSEKKIGIASRASTIGIQVQKIINNENAPKEKLPAKTKKGLNETNKRQSSTESHVSVIIGHKKKSSEIGVVTNRKSSKIKATEKPKQNQSKKSIISLPFSPSKSVLHISSDFTKDNIHKAPKVTMRRNMIDQGFEFSRGKNRHKSITHQKNINRKEKNHGTKVVRKYEVASQTKFTMKKQPHMVGNSLKRCFCTLRFKGKSYKPQQTISVVPTGKKSNINQFKDSVTSIDERKQTKVVRSRGAMVIQPRNRKRKDQKQHSSISSTIIEPIVAPLQQKQAVKISSSFSFNIKFYKDNPIQKVIQPAHKIISKDIVHTRNKGTHKRRQFRHRRSQISSSTGRSKYTLTKYSLRRCFCSLKLGQPDKKINNLVSHSVGSSTPQKLTPGLNNKYVNIHKAVSTKPHKKRYLQPYECEPGICIPGECDPYKCLEIINKRRNKYNKNTYVQPHHIARHFNTDHYKTRSTSSVTSGSVPYKTKKVQSAIGVKEKKNRQKHKTLRQIKTTPSSPDRQVVKLSSSFNFSIEFYNHFSSPVSARQVFEKRPSKSTTIVKKRRMKDRSYQKGNVKRHQKSTSTAIKNRGSFIAPMKRCFCTLKLQTNKQRENKGTVTPLSNAIDEKNILHTKGTKIKQDNIPFDRHIFKDYECERGICDPGECDPYECLHRIMKGRLKDSGTLTKRTKSKPGTTDTLRNKNKSRGSSARTKYRVKKLSTKHQKDINVSNNKKNIDNFKPQTQGVCFGSAFSFDIEFRKNKLLSQNIQDGYVIGATYPKLRINAINPSARYSDVRKSYGSSEETPMKAHKAVNIRPLLKRCFCTLKYQSSQSKKNETIIKSPKVTAVSIVTTTETKTKSRMYNGMPKINRPIETFNSNIKVIRYKSHSSRTCSKSSIDFKYKEMQSFFRNNSDRRFNISLKHIKQRNKLFLSDLFLPAFRTNDETIYTYSENCILKRKRNEIPNLLEQNSFAKNKNILSNTYNTSFITEHDFYTSRHGYYAMNVHVPERKRLYKLKSYECEPGVCVPDECDPYECQKLIMRRLNPNVLRKSGTTFYSKFMTSSTGASTSSSKAVQSQRPRRKNKKSPAGLKFETMPKRGHKHAVRVGSTFSFNMEFSKVRMSPHVTNTEHQKTVKYKPMKSAKTKIKTKGSNGHRIEFRNRGSQLGKEIIHRGSGVNPMIRKCFCTLKLQKKGKNTINQDQSAFQKAFHKGTETPPNTFNDFISSRLVTNASQNAAVLKTYKALPDECEPNVCVPGECNPHECLERIKRRNNKIKNIGTGAMTYKTSTGSMTRRHRFHTQGEQKHLKRRSKYTKSKASTKRKTRGSSVTKTSRVEVNRARTSRQVVRIGSNFSFNIDFFKEKSPYQQPIVVRRELSQPTVAVDHVSKFQSYKKSKKDRGLQGSKSVKHQDSQIKNITEGKSTMTAAFLKRCFCTAKFHVKQKEKPKKLKPVLRIASHAANELPFLKRCVCVMQKAVKFSNQPFAETSTITVDKSVITGKEVVPHDYKTSRYNLKPFECEPGLCVPGYCNPYECEKLIKARNFKMKTREAFTERPITKSISSNYSSQISKARRTQSNFKSGTSSIKSKPVKPIKEMLFRKQVYGPFSNQQVVRIGSSFSFDVEFYKDRSPKTVEVQAAANSLRYRPSQNTKIKTAKTGIHSGTKDQGSMKSKVTNEQETQAKKTKMIDRDSGFGSILKRCFCTLKLQNQKRQPLYFSSQGTKTPAIKEVPTHYTRGVGTGNIWKLKRYDCEPGVCVPYECHPSECENLINKGQLKESTKTVMRISKGNNKQLNYKLIQYNCEPNVCIPRQCDPIECEKRIKLRNMKNRSFGTSTKGDSGKSKHSSYINVTPSLRARKVHHKNKENRKRPISVSSKPTRLIKFHDLTHTMDHFTKRSVQIGSGFSIDVGFFKNTSHFNVDNNSRPVKLRKIQSTRSTSSLTYQHLSRSKHKKIQHHSNVNHTESQVWAQKMQNIGVSPLLKRCFCTLKLQKSGPILSNPQILSKAARDKNVYMATLLPYECEPGTCFPGDCDPYECKKKIQKRLMHSQRSGTERTSQDSSTSSTLGSKNKAVSSQPNKYPQSRKYQKASYAKRDYETVEPLQSSQSSSRQAVRMGSSFTFDVEFFKSSSQKSEYVPKIRPTYTKKGHNIITTAIPKKTRSRYVTSNGNIKLHHNKMQTGSRTESKSTGFGPRLKRCFCTLALHKNKDQPETRTKSTFRNDDLSDLYAYSRNIGVGTRKRFHPLKPYECELGVCVPGQCDPYECYKKIKHRMRDSETATKSPSKRYGSSITSKGPKYRSTNTQYSKDRKYRDRPTMANFKECAPVCRAKPCNNINHNRQAVRVGSNISFSMEFYKYRPNNVKLPKEVYKTKPLENTPKLCKPEIQNLNKKKSIQNRYTNRTAKSGMVPLGQNKKSQVDLKNNSRGTTIGSFLKRCFCTLNFRKNSKPAEETLKPRQEKYKALKRSVLVQTRGKYSNKVKGYALKPYECEPNVCIPGECNPYECEERIKRRNLRRYSRKIGTRRRSSQISVGSMASNFVPRTNRCTDATCPKRTRNTAQHYQQQTPKLVEQPRLANMIASLQRPAIKVGSNMSFNIEFYKDKSQGQTCSDQNPCFIYKPMKTKVKNHHKVKTSILTESKPSSMHRKIGYRPRKRTSESQADGAKTKNQAAGMDLIRKCFCTLKLQKNTRPPQIITVNRLAIETDKKCKGNANAKYINNGKISPPSKFVNNCNLSAKNTNSILNSAAKPCRTHLAGQARANSLEMTTIYPYIPQNYNSNRSETVILYDKKSRFLCHHRTYLRKRGCTIDNCKNDDKRNKDTRTNKQECPLNKSTHKGKVKLFFKHILSSFFTKNKLSVTVHNITGTNRTKLPVIKDQLIDKTDTLKASKSDRRHTEVKIESRPKKSVSLKMDKILEKKSKKKDEVLHIQSKKQYFWYQSGDTGEPHRNTSALDLKSCIPECTMLSAYKKNNYNNFSAYGNNHTVQMAMIHSANIREKHTRSKGIITTVNNANNHATYKEKLICFCKKNRNKNEDSLHLKNGRKGCPCPLNIKELVLTSEDLIPQKVKRKSKKVNFEDTSNPKISNQIDKRMKRSMSSGDGPLKEKTDIIDRKHQQTVPCCDKLYNKINCCIAGKRLRGKSEAVAKERLNEMVNGTDIVENFYKKSSQKILSFKDKDKNRHVAKVDKSKFKVYVDKDKKLQTDMKNKQSKYKFLKNTFGDTKPSDSLTRVRKEKRSQKSSKDKSGDKRVSKIKDSIIEKQVNEPNKLLLRSPSNITDINSKKSIIEKLRKISFIKSKGDMLENEEKPQNPIQLATPKKLFRKKSFKEIFGVANLQEVMCKKVKQIELKRQASKKPKQLSVINNNTKLPETQENYLNTKSIQGKPKHVNDKENKTKPEFVNKGKMYLKGPSGDGKEIKSKDKETKKVLIPVFTNQDHNKAIGAKITIKGKGAYNMSNLNKLTAKTNKLNKRCVCGTAICGKEIEKNMEHKKKVQKLKSRPCTCGSASCATEAKRERSIKSLKSKKAQKKQINQKPTKKAICICQSEEQKEKKRLKIKALNEKRRIEELKVLRKQFKEQDKRRLKERKRIDKILEKQVAIYRESSDSALCCESVLDVVKLGATTAVDIARCTGRAIIHPRHTIRNVKMAARHPCMACEAIGRAVSSSGAGSTIKRVKARCIAMRRVKEMSEKLESNAITSFIIHMFDKDPKKRLARKKRITRKRETMDFECSLFMASLRKRPCLAVYYTCPWFYPHCLSMLTLWKQFIDVVLFLIAVVVWSPCIVAMEICRAAVCCFFCTG